MDLKVGDVVLTQDGDKVVIVMPQYVSSNFIGNSVGVVDFETLKNFRYMWCDKLKEQVNIGKVEIEYKPDNVVWMFSKRPMKYIEMSPSAPVVG